MQIIPALLPHNFQEVDLKLSRIKGFANRVQIDICDGEFGAEKTWLPDGKEILPSEFSYEFDIMLNDWEVSTLQCLALKAESIVVHVDLFTDGDMETLVSIISPHDVALGVCVSNDRGLDFHADMIRKAKGLYHNVFIQVMGIEDIGSQGQLSDEVTVGRIKALKEHFPDILIQVDGGIKMENLKIVKEAGADSVVVGSAIFGTDDARESLKNLQSIVS